MYRLSLALLFAIASTSVAWAQRDLKNIPDPDPELERKTFILPEGAEVNLWAGDPQMHKPIQMNFDAQGRLWIASSEVYPQIKPGQEATDGLREVAPHESYGDENAPPEQSTGNPEDNPVGLPPKAGYSERDPRDDGEV